MCLQCMVKAEIWLFLWLFCLVFTSCLVLDSLEFNQEVAPCETKLGHIMHVYSHTSAATRGVTALGDRASVRDECV